MAEERPWSIRRVLAWTAEDFRRRGIDSARLDAELLLARALELDRVALIVQADRELDPASLQAYRELIKRRRAGEPVAYILGEREFYGHRFRVDRRVLIPRPDTETLVEVGLQRTRARDLYGRALDLCTGSGCVAIAFARQRPTWSVTGVDISPEAVASARDNSLRLGAAHNTRFLVGDLVEPVVADEPFDLIMANPPYIPVAELAELPTGIREFEPRQALDGGPDGLRVTARVVEQAAHRLAPDGVLACEVGAGQADQVAELLERACLQAIERRRDYGGHDRVVSGRHAG